MDKKTGSKKRTYGGKNSARKRQNALMKIIGGVVFAAACFAAAFILLEFHDTYWLVGLACLLLMGAAFFFLNAIFSSKEDVFDDLIQAQEALEEVKEEDRQRAEEEFRKSIEEQVASLDRTSRAMFAAMKKNSDAQEEQMERLQQKLDKVIDEQNAGIKTIVKYNKENARQVAECEKESLEAVKETISSVGAEISKIGGKLSDEISINKTVLDNIASQAATVAGVTTKAAVLSPNFAPAPSVVMAAPAIAAPTMAAVAPAPVAAAAEPVVTAVPAETPAEVPAEVPAEEPKEPEELFDLPEEVISDSILDEFLNGITEEVEADEAAALLGESPIAEEPVIEEPVIEEPAIEEPVIEAPAEDTSGGLMSDADIAALFASAAAAEAPAAEEPVIDEPVIEAPAEDTSGGLMSDADIAALFASAAAAEAPSTDDLLADAVESDDDKSIDEINAEIFGDLLSSVSEEPEPVEEKSAHTTEADLAAATGVDLSDPNASLSPEDIAKLFAAAGN